METKLKPISIIIVEDFKLTRVGLRCALNANVDLEVITESDNATDGLKLIEKHRPDVVLMDLGLPTMNGIEAIAKIREFSKDIKIIKCITFFFIFICFKQTKYFIRISHFYIIYLVIRIIYNIYIINWRIR